MSRVEMPRINSLGGELRGTELFPCSNDDQRAQYLHHHEEYLSAHREVREKLNETLCHISKLCRAVARECEIDLAMDMHLQNVRDMFELTSHEIQSLHGMLQGEKRRTAILFDEYQKMLDTNSFSHEANERFTRMAQDRRSNHIKVREEQVNPPECVDDEGTLECVLGSQPWYTNTRADQICQCLRHIKSEISLSIHTGRFFLVPPWTLMAVR
ncbi:hypothetical protein GUITHDRAFT_136728 [Guillardia theta CCMP2712]|uniref:Uncharacterized protein n=1 Tax=Guillardia theta (strain CCMP2712) TaxID=905079 RepID=L1JKH2_GUITC|nr:hypothetical protein GUITHDRAFT_136728 [Guillardia theta CCMP2712]EKX48644.1 hypothetical protein GUITHDRAFT_136728 [Guillardia theta CCMP2712]|eukprot:XP_005835624.1 hypothetical protein GUITHDRAFT_136728 [Guillardia theta CCMP2712]